MKLQLLCLLVIGCTVSGRPHQPTTAVGSPAGDYSQHWTRFSKIKDLIDRINIRKFREEYGQAKKVSDDSLVEIDLTEEAINFPVEESTAIVNPTEAEVTTITAIEEHAPAVVEERIGEASEDPVEEITTGAAAIEDTTAAIVEAADDDAATTAAAIVEDVVTTAAAIETEVAAATTAAATTAAATTAAATTAAAATEASELPEAVDEENEVVDTFFVSEETIQSAKKFGYKILLKKVNGKTVPVGKIKFSFPTYIEIDPVSEPQEEEAAAVTTEAPIAADEAIATEAPVEGTEAPAVITETVDDSVEEITEEAVAAVEEVTTAAIEETTTAIAIIVPKVVEVVVPEIGEVSAETVNAGADKVVEDTQLAIHSLQDIQEEVEVTAGCSVSMAEIESLVVSLARNIRESTPILEQIVSIGKKLANVEDTAQLLRFGGELLELLEPFLESILPATSASSCEAESPNAMLVSLSSMATGLDVVANSVENVESGMSSSLHEAATSLQLAAWILSELQKSVYTLYQQEGTCGQNGSTVSILKTLAKAMDGYKPVFDVLGTETSIEELEETVAAINSAVGILEGLGATAGGLPGVSCSASLAEMGSALKQLAEFVVNLEANGV